MKYKFSFYFLIQLILFIFLNNEDKNNIEIKGIYKIYSLLNNSCLTDEHFIIFTFIIIMTKMANYLEFIRMMKIHIPLNQE